VTAALTEPRPDPESLPQATGRTRRGPRWWLEILYGAIFYAIYSAIRDVRGTKPVSVFQAYTNATRVIRVERFLHIFHEQAIQSWFLGWHWFLRFWDAYYGSGHFIVTIAALLFLFFRQPQRYALWRNVLAITTALALLGFAFFPLMPPRLLPESYGFVDTLRSVGGLWSFDSGPMNAVSNQYAAMPSLHFAWSTWCALVFAPTLKHWWSKALVFLYPVATLFCIVVTANHYFLDALGGALCLAVGYLLGRLLTSLSDARKQRQVNGPSPAPSSPVRSLT
jgi:membrane-associated phospholipid phosphatase